jgi:hypothetical protein
LYNKHKSNINSILNKNNNINSILNINSIIDYKIIIKFVILLVILYIYINNERLGATCSFAGFMHYNVISIQYEESLL